VRCGGSFWWKDDGCVDGGGGEGLELEWDMQRESSICTAWMCLFVRLCVCLVFGCVCADGLIDSFWRVARGGGMCGLYRRRGLQCGVASVWDVVKVVDSWAREVTVETVKGTTNQ
jgi:hypothetical protein